MLVSSVRCFEVSDFESEKAAHTDLDQQLSEITTKNRQSNDLSHKEQPQNLIVLKNLRMRYAKHLPLVLKGINLEVKAGSKVGIVGRTGSGKSTILQVLLRFYEPEEGSTYELYGLDSLKLGLNSLRKQISLIPQNPFLLKSSIRDNLDPENRSTDEQLWEVISECRLADKINLLEGKLDTVLHHPNSLFSFG